MLQLFAYPTHVRAIAGDVPIHLAEELRPTGTAHIRVFVRALHCGMKPKVCCQTYNYRYTCLNFISSVYIRVGNCYFGLI